MASSRKSIPDNLIKWDLSNEPLAPLTQRQREYLSNIEEEVSSLDTVNFSKPIETSASNSSNISSESSERIESYQELLRCYATLEERYVQSEDIKYMTYLEQLESRHKECEELCAQIRKALEDFSLLSKQYAVMSGKTTSLHNASEQLISDQEKLSSFVSGISDYVKYFKEADLIMDKLDAPTLSVNSDMFFNLLAKIDDNMIFMQSNPTFKESAIYLVKYRHCQFKAIMFIQNYIFKVLDKATESILNPTKDSSNSESTQKNSDAAAMALFYGRFQSILPKVKPVIEQIEARSYKRQEYDSLLTECHQHYLSQRGLVLGPSVQKGLQSIKEKYNGDHCSLVRHSCALLLHASIDEHRLFYQFFTKLSTSLTAYLESLCTSLYDTLRPFIIHINHLETLAEICCILRIEMLDEHVQSNSEALEGFGNICLQLLHDVQERLVFRAHLYLQSDVLSYKPSPGDLAYPEKLKMMEDIAESIRKENRQMRLKRISLSSMESGNSFEPVSRTHLAMDAVYQRARNSNSPADLHGMWYPTVRRTLVCLSRLYRCVDRPVFQSLSQEAITLCVQSIENAKEQILARSSVLDAKLFQVKHLLILREQIAPFQVDLTIKEYSLDFSKVKTAAFGLLEKRSRLFTLSNNALLEFLLEGAPQMKEHLIDSRKHVDAKLKSTCQSLIQHVTTLLIRPVLNLLEKGKPQSDLADNEVTKEPFGTAQDIAAVVSEALRLIKFKLPSIQQSMQLYLANRETECILFRPIKNNIVAAFTQLSQLLNTHYSAEELLLIACPLPEQVSVMLSSSSLAQGKLVENNPQQDVEEEQKKIQRFLSEGNLNTESQNQNIDNPTVHFKKSGDDVT